MVGVLSIQQKVSVCCEGSVATGGLGRNSAVAETTKRPKPTRPVGPRNSVKLNHCASYVIFKCISSRRFKLL